MKSQPITSITVEGGSTIEVAALPKNIQDLVDLYNDFLPQIDESRINYMLSQAASKEVIRELTVAVQEWQKQSAAQAPAVVAETVQAKPVAKKRKR